MIKTLSIDKYGANYKISEHFTLGEFRCKDGSDTVKYSTELLAMLEKLRAYGGFTITITSGYRTKKYNDSIGGASRSQHIDGTAADIIVKKDGGIVNAKLICCLCQTMGFRGIGYISGDATHVDMRPSGSYRGDERGGYGGNVNNDFYSYFHISDNKIAELWRPQNADNSAKEEEEKEVAVYNKIEDVPAYYRPSIQRLIDKELLKGTGGGEINVSEDFCRIMTILDRAGIFDVIKSAISAKEIANVLVEIAQSYK